jgi:hypothetical protein
MADVHCLTPGCTTKPHGFHYLCSICTRTIKGKITFLKEHCRARNNATPSTDSCKAAVMHIINTVYQGQSRRSFRDDEWHMAADMACRMDSWTVEMEVKPAADQPSVEFFIDQLESLHRELQANPRMNTRQVREVRLAFYRGVWSEAEFARFQAALRKIHALVCELHVM